MICLPSGLAGTGGALVTRKKVGGGKSLKEKHIGDIWVQNWQGWSEMQVRPLHTLHADTAGNLQENTRMAL